MILMVILFLFMLFVGALISKDATSAYDEYCNLECWSRRKPCCRVH